MAIRAGKEGGLTCSKTPASGLLLVRERPPQPPRKAPLDAARPNAVAVPPPAGCEPSSDVPDGLPLASPAVPGGGPSPVGRGQHRTHSGMVLPPHDAKGWGSVQFRGGKGSRGGETSTRGPRGGGGGADGNRLGKVSRVGDMFRGFCAETPSTQFQGRPSKRAASGIRNTCRKSREAVGRAAWSGCVSKSGAAWLSEGLSSGGGGRLYLRRYCADSCGYPPAVSAAPPPLATRDTAVKVALRAPPIVGEREG